MPNYTDSQNRTTQDKIKNPPSLLQWVGGSSSRTKSMIRLDSVRQRRKKSVPPKISPTNRRVVLLCIGDERPNESENLYTNTQISQTGSNKPPPQLITQNVRGVVRRHWWVENFALPAWASSVAQFQLETRSKHSFHQNQYTKTPGICEFIFKADWGKHQAKHSLCWLAKPVGTGRGREKPVRGAGPAGFGIGECVRSLNWDVVHTWCCVEKAGGPKCRAYKIGEHCYKNLFFLTTLYICCLKLWPSKA